MRRISRRVSVQISLALTILFFVALVVCAFAMPWLVDVFLDMKEGTGRGPFDVSATGGFVIAVAYLILVVAAVTDGFLLRLLLLVKKGQVFTATSISSLRAISWCCVLAGVLFMSIGWCFMLSLAVGFVAVFVGLCLRVMKNVVEEATLIKSENDLTV